jgi:general secretion pathway protein L
MPSISPEARFLGVDLRSLWGDVCRPWLRMREGPVLALLTPVSPVRLLQADGGTSSWVGGAPQPAHAGWVGFVAVELPEEDVLRRSLTLPALGGTDIANAVRLEVLGMSPFTADDAVWGYGVRGPRRGTGTVRVDIALTSRKLVARYLESQAARLQGMAQPEVWVLAGQEQPIVLAGYGEHQRVAYARRWRHVGYALLVSMVLLGGAIALTPVAQLRLRAKEAVGAFDAARQRTAPLVHQRESLLQSADQIKALSDILRERADPVHVIDKLTQVLPDETFLQGLHLQGNKVVISGMTTNASVLMQLLSAQPGFRDVRAPAAATRNPGAAKENFVIEFTLDPQLFSIVRTEQRGAAVPAVPVNAVASPASAAASPATGSASAGGAAVSPPAVVPVASPAKPSGAVFGGTVSSPAPKQTASSAAPAGKAVP